MTFFWPRWVRSNIFDKKRVVECGMQNVPIDFQKRNIRNIELGLERKNVHLEITEIQSIPIKP